MGWMAIAAPILMGGAQIAGGIAQSAQDRAAAQQYDQNAKNAMTAADQSEAQRRGDLISTMSSIDAIRTSRNLDVASPTGMALAADTTRRAEAGIATDRLNFMQTAQADKTQAGIMRSQGSAALLGGFLKGGSSIFGGISDARRYG